MNSGDFCPDRHLPQTKQYAHDSGPVRSRFLSYELTDTPVDFEVEAYFAVDTKPTDTIVDFGTADGVFLDRAEYEFGHRGTRIGIDINMAQFDRNIYPHVPNGLIDEKLRLALPESVEAIQSQHSSLMRSQKQLQFHAIAGDITQIPLRSDSVDRAYALFMMYDVAEEYQKDALQEISRVLTDTGTLILTTSDGYENNIPNKLVQRQILADAGYNLNITPRQDMNTSFTTARAAHMLTALFAHVRMGVQRATMSLRDEEDVAVYMSSLHTMRDQFYPVPNSEEYTLELDVQRSKIMHIIRNKGVFYDVIRRSIFIASNTPTQVAFTSPYLKDLGELH